MNSAFAIPGVIIITEYPFYGIGSGGRVQGKPRYDVQHAYGRSNAAMS
ncbi:MAG: hypothetical protein AAF959_17530 [Cyanobacteria bacterium P01_D01_bin.56]